MAGAPEVAFIFVEDECKEITSVAPSALVDKEYTITDNQLFYQFDKFVPSPIVCDLEYTFTVDPPLSNVITLNSASNSF